MQVMLLYIIYDPGSLVQYLVWAEKRFDSSGTQTDWMIHVWMYSGWTHNLLHDPLGLRNTPGYPIRVSTQGCNNEHFGTPHAHHYRICKNEWPSSVDLDLCCSLGRKCELFCKFLAFYSTNLGSRNKIINWSPQPPIMVHPSGSYNGSHNYVP